MVDYAQAGLLLSIDRVKDEIDKQKDAVQAWAESTFSSWFVSTNDTEILAAYKRVMAWAYSQK